MSYPVPPNEPVALVGSSCRFAGGVTSPSDLWRLLADPQDLTRIVPASRFSADGFFHRDAEYHGTTNAPYAYWLEQDHRAFDASFFNITPKEAEAMDPQQRLLLEVVYEALESAGYTLQQIAGHNVAVFAGVMTRDYDTLTSRDDLNVSQYAATGNARSIISNRISYFFDFRGPSMTIDTACSASLVALHQAVQSLRSGETSMACVAGVNLMLTPEQFIAESNLHMLSPSGRCQMWDEKADGYARGEGVAALFLKPLSSALADGDHIQGIIRETGVNSDGRTKGITMPSSEAQTSLIRQTYQKSGLNSLNPAHHPQFFEAHGTGTPVGDPIEARAISKAFFVSETNASCISHEKELLVGSVKTVIGHTEGAAGLAGLLKVVQAMEHGLIPPNLHLSKLNPAIAALSDALQIPIKSAAWPSPPIGQPRRASVNSFGFGGTNAHAIIERYEPCIHDKLAGHQTVNLPPQIQPSASNATCEARILLPLCFSAASEKCLKNNLRSFRDYLLRNPTLNYGTLGWHTFHHKTTHPFRTTVVADGSQSAVKALDSLIDNNKDGKIGHRATQQTYLPKALGIFTGQGAQYATMAQNLFETNAIFRRTIKELDIVLQNCPDPPDENFLEQHLQATKETSQIHTAQVSQVLCTALQISLVEMLRSLGIEFSAVVGHSSGEIAAAYAAGQLSQRDAILIAYYRGKYTPLARSSAGGRGGMLACGLSRNQAETFCNRLEYSGKLHLAASNSPTLATLSGDLDAVEQAVTALKSQDIFVRQLNVDTAYHSLHMQEPAKAYSKALKVCGIQPSPRRGGPLWFSSVVLNEEQDIPDLDNKYWVDNMINPVQFREAVEVALRKCRPFDCIIEVGPHPALKAPTRETMKSSGSANIPYLSLLDRTKDDLLAVASFLGDMWTKFGPGSINIANFIQSSPHPEIMQSRLIDAPKYAWDHSQIYWRESRLSEQYHFRKHSPHELLGVRTSDDTNFEMRWRNILKLEKLPWVEGHKFQGQSLLPASAYCVMALDAAKTLLDGREASIIELQNLDFMSGITLEADSMGVETLFSLSIRSAGDNVKLIEADFDLASVPITSSRFAPMKKNFSGSARIFLETSGKSQLPHRRPAARAETLPVSVDAFYDMMYGVGLDYTGPFRSLKSLDRRLDYALGTLDSRHATETTGLAVSPAMLDSCFHTSFATYSSPGDRSLWTTFLPTKIARLAFNVAGDSPLNVDNELLVETYLTSFKPHSVESASTIISDLEVYHSEHGQMAIQLEGLTVQSFAATKPANDYELYLHTVYELDPEDEIIAPAADFSVGQKKLVAPTKGGKRATQNLPPSTPPESPNDSDSETLVFSPCLKDEAIHLETKPFDMPLVDRQVPQFTDFRSHLARIVQQIMHKYPRMRVLDMTEPDHGLTQPVLEQFNGTFVSYNIGREADPNHQQWMFTIKGNEKIKNEVLDMSENPDEGSDHDHLNDLVIISISALENSESRLALLKQIRKVTRNGGFLIFIDMIRTKSDDMTRETSETVSKRPATPPEWPHWLTTDCDFMSAAKNSNQYFPSVANICVRQAGGHESGQIATIHPNLPALKNLLIVGDQPAIYGSLLAALKPYCERLTTANSLEDIPEDSAASCTAILLLADLDEPICSSMTSSRLEMLKALVRPGVVILWVTLNAHENPDQASSLGLTRSLKAETPNLTLQVLDLKSLDDENTAFIYRTFSRLCSYHELELEGISDGHIEPEIHVDGGKIWIPRVVPYQPAIDRLNAYRRVVTKKVDTRETPVQLQAGEASTSAASQYDFEVSENLLDQGRAMEGYVTVNVEYSSLQPVQIGNGKGLYTFAGRRADSGQLVVGCSQTSASVVRVQPEMVRDVETLMTNTTTLDMITSTWHMLLAIRLLDRSQQKDIVLVEPDKMLLDCIRHILSGQSTRRLLVWSSDSEFVQDAADAVYMHPWSTAREVKQALGLSSEKCAVINFLDGDDKLSGTLSSMQGSLDYCGISEILSAKDKQLDIDVDSWKAAVDHTTTRLSTANDPTPSSNFYAIAPSQILENRKSPNKYPIGTMIDWTTYTSLSLHIKPLANSQCLRRDRTYLLIGLTRDLGQSICRLFISQGARHIVIASRSPDMSPAWVSELNAQGARIIVERVDITDLSNVQDLHSRIVSAANMPPVGGVVNGAMILDDRIFSKMDISTWHRVLGPKTIGSKNLDTAFSDPCLEFFIMTSSFAAIGGHAGQSNYAAANMFMNGLAANRRKRGLAASALNIGVIYGLGLLAREDRRGTYSGLERDGYPPISERDLHHMFMEAIEAGRPVAGQVGELTTGLARYRVDDPNPMHWHLDRRFCHFTVDKAAENGQEHGVENKQTLRESLEQAGTDTDQVANVLLAAFCRRVEAILQHPAESVNGEASFAELGVDSLAAVEIRNWVYKAVGQDVPVMKILGASTIVKLCTDVAEKIVEGRKTADVEER